ncbi:MAG: N-acetylmuramoyl-L-alanine amidase [Christensenellaceae bacterium]|jgi:N-acetylmuramoyl-L-alanine amidase|nr:N-acetylmuramoyl-L-alanine amidase [Christensenellaceae bacterium]
MATVTLDAGHGGYDPGAVNGTRLEKNDNLRMALAVGTYLRQCGVNVVYTRSTDVFIPLAERANISNRANSDLFVSFHRNSNANPQANGVENWIYTSASPKALAAADLVLSRLVNQGVQSNRGIQRGTFYVLKYTNAPAMLIELGFISNAEDNRLFDTRFDAYARAIASGILSSLGVNCQPGGTVTPPPVVPPVVPPPTPPTPPTVTPPIVPPPPAGDYTATIRYIQNALNTRYGQNLAVDGVWGPLSYRALLRAYQLELNRSYGAGLTVDGAWGPRTRVATRTLRQGDRGNLVWLLQAALYVNGFPAAPDGAFGPMTDIHVRNFQRANGLAVDGVVGPNTWERLFART